MQRVPRRAYARGRPARHRRRRPTSSACAGPRQIGALAHWHWRAARGAHSVPAAVRLHAFCGLFVCLVLFSYMFVSNMPCCARAAHLLRASVLNSSGPACSRRHCSRLGDAIDRACRPSAAAATLMPETLPALPLQYCWAHHCAGTATALAPWPALRTGGRVTAGFQRQPTSRVAPAACRRNRRAAAVTGEQLLINGSMKVALSFWSRRHDGHGANCT